MKKIAVYPGSFNPWHQGHQDVLTKAMAVFDFIIIAVGYNPEKTSRAEIHEICKKINVNPQYAEVRSMNGFLKDFVKGCGAVAVIKGLRNGSDLEYEKTQQYWNEDFGMDVPTFFVIADRNLTHISSSAIRAVEKIKNNGIKS